MATAQVKQLHRDKPVPVLVVDRRGRPQWHPVFENNPKITTRANRGHQPLYNAAGLRPYIVAKAPDRWTWKPWAIEPGELYLTPAERGFAAPFAGCVMVEPNVKENGHTNKAWPWDRWQALVDAVDVPFIQCVPPGARGLVHRRVWRIETPTFRYACAVLAVSKAFVGTEGGLHHAAAALGIPAVVLFSEFISPAITGYRTHRNIHHAGEPCGSRLPCAGCAAAMNAITVDEVATNLRGVLH